MSGVTEIVSLKKDQVLQLEVGSSHGKPTYAEYSHEELLGILTRRERSASRRSKSVESKASRTVGLMCRAIQSGKWSTGADIDKTDIITRLTTLLNSLSDEQIHTLTPKADTALNDLHRNASLQAAFPLHMNQLSSAWLR